MTRIEEPLSFDERFRRFGAGRTSDAEFEEWLDREPERRAQWEAIERQHREDREAIDRIEEELRSRHPELDDAEIYARAYGELLATKVSATRLSRHGSPALRCPSVQLRLRAEHDVSWVQVSRETELRGHGSSAWELTRAHLEQAVENLRKHPSYRKGRDGYGSTDVIPWDYGHQSEVSPDKIPPGGVPAVAWTQDLEVRAGADGKAELWSKTRWLATLRDQIRRGEYQWASIAIQLEALDVATGAPIGALITSIAATNMPAVMGMQPLAASRNFSPHQKETPVDLDLRAVEASPGRNRHEKMRAYLTATRPGFSKLSYDEQWRQAFELSKATLEFDTSAPRAPSGSTTPATPSNYVSPVHRLDEYLSAARSMFSDLSEEEAHKVAGELQRAAVHGASAAREGKTWDGMWGSWDLYSRQLLPSALPERHRGKQSALESRMRRLFDEEFAKFSELRDKGFVMSRGDAPKIDLSACAGRNKFERAFSYLEVNSPGFAKRSREEQWAMAFELAKTPGVKGD